MEPVNDWKMSLSTTDRYENIQKLKMCIEKRGAAPSGSSQKTAASIEKAAFNSCSSREAYEAACNVFSDEPLLQTKEDAHPEPNSPGITIAKYHNCHHIASGLTSQVYRSKSFAVKVITRTRNSEPHNPSLEIKLLSKLSHPSVIRLTEAFHDSSCGLILVFPYQPHTVATVLSAGTPPLYVIKSIFRSLFSALNYLHTQSIIHRDIKPSNLLLRTAAGPALLSDFGTAWHPSYSLATEPANQKVLEVGTTAYRAPEVLFGNHAYDTSLDLWSAGTVLAECLYSPPRPLFESRDSGEDGNQLGLILSIFKTLGTPTRESWPEAENFGTPPFEWYNEFPSTQWTELLPGDEKGRDLVSGLVTYQSSRRISAAEALKHAFLKTDDET